MDLTRLISSMEALGHAYAIEGSEPERDLIIAHLARLGFSAKAHPDAFVRSYGSFGIEESREIGMRAARKPLLGERNVFILTAPAMTIEAQNALLKTFEEPASVTTFFLIMPSIETLLPTLRSRMQLLSTDAPDRKRSLIDADSFIKATVPERIAQLGVLLDDRGERTTGDAIAFLSALERALAARDLRDQDAAEGLRAVYRARRYLGDKGALLKPLLEQVAVLLP